VPFLHHQDRDTLEGQIPAISAEKPLIKPFEPVKKSNSHPKAQALHAWVLSGRLCLESL